MTITSAANLKTHLGEYLDKARTEPIIVQKSGRDVAVLISKEEYDCLSSRTTRQPRQCSFAKDFFEGVDINKLLETPLKDFEEDTPDCIPYQPRMAIEKLKMQGVSYDSPSQKSYVPRNDSTYHLLSRSSASPIRIPSGPRM